MMKIYFLLSFILVSTYYSYAKEETNKSPVKALIVRQIMNKVSDTALTSLSKVSDHKKDLILKKIELKLRKTAKGLVDKDKYIKIIMQEFKNKAYAGNNKENENKTYVTKEKGNIINTDHEGIETKNKIKLLQVNKTNFDSKSERISPKRKIFDPLIKQKIISDIAKKIDIVAKAYLKDSQTLDEQQGILKKIEERIMNSSRRKHMQIHDEHNDLKAYTALITKGLELAMNRLISSKTRRVDDSESEEVETVDNINYNETNGMNMKLINRYKSFFSEVLSETSIDPHCTDVVQGICLRIESLLKLSCGDGRVVALDQLCNGVFDCWNEADETNCSLKAIDKIQRSINLMSDIDESITTKCLQPLVGGVIFSHHHKTLLNMLNSQLDFLNNNNITSRVKDLGNTYIIKNSISDATSVVKALSSALDLNLCLPFNGEGKILSRKSMNNEFINKNDEQTTGVENVWYPKSCTCKREYCQFDNCDSRCKRICSQIYRLNRWKCPSVSGDGSISMDLICDGKLDCFDETDETSCAATNGENKFRANVIFNEIVDLLSLKSLSVEFEYSRNKLVALTGLTRQQQKLSLNSKLDPHTIKINRDEYFKMLVHIFSDAMRKSNLEELDSTHEFLTILNEKMVDALKRSHTGNVNVIPPAGCYCRNSTCVQVRCTPKCYATCAIEPFLTKYSCQVNNESVPLKSICNGKQDCPNGADETDCKKEICRSHHLVLLGHNLQKAGKTLQRSALGEAFESWQTKVMTTLQILERRDRPNHKMLEDTILDILHDLVSTYASIEDAAKNSARRLISEFVNVSNVVKETLKLCGN